MRGDVVVLNVLPLSVPPLRQRRADIPQLVEFFQQRFARKFGKAVEAVSLETMQLLIHYPWPGNIRELQNVIERAVVAVTDGAVSHALKRGRSTMSSELYQRLASGLPALANERPPGNRNT